MASWGQEWLPLGHLSQLEKLNVALSQPHQSSLMAAHDLMLTATSNQHHLTHSLNCRPVLSMEAAKKRHYLRKEEGRRRRKHDLSKHCSAQAF